VTAGAANGDALQIGGSNTCSAVTNLTSSGASDGMVVTADGAGFVGIRGVCDTNGATGVLGHATLGYGLVGIGGAAPLALSPNAGVGPPSGTHFRGEFYIDGTGSLFLCTATGSPATWVKLSSPLVTIPPARVYDSRVGQLPATGPKSPITNGATVNVDVTGNSSGVPSGASGVLGNITVVLPSGGVALTVFGEGQTQPATSNINASVGGIVANNFTSKVGTSNGISIFGSGGPTDFVIDIFGYYP
jgi:hypothetical protein